MKYIHYNVCDKITYPFPSFEMWEWTIDSSRTL